MTRLRATLFSSTALVAATSLGIAPAQALPQQTAASNNNASALTTGTLNPARLPAEIGDVARPAGSATNTLQPGVVKSGNMALGSGAFPQTVAPSAATYQASCQQLGDMFDSAGSPAAGLAVTLPSGCGYWSGTFVSQSGVPLKILPPSGYNLVANATYYTAAASATNPFTVNPTGAAEGQSVTVTEYGSNFVVVTGPPPSDLTSITSGRPWVDVRALGAKGDGATDDTNAFLAAIAIANPLSARINVPAGNYCINGGTAGAGLVLAAGSVEIVGTGNPYIHPCNGAQLTTLTVNYQYAKVINLVVSGPDLASGPSAPTGNALTVGGSCTGCYFENLGLQRGLHALQNGASDAVFLNVRGTEAYGTSLAYLYNISGGGQAASGYYIRDKWDQNYPVLTPPQGTAAPVAWAASTQYNVGALVTIANGSILQAGCASPPTAGNYHSCAAGVAGTTGTTAPVEPVYDTPETDGSLVWLLAMPSLNYAAFTYDSGTSVPYSWGNDYSGAFGWSIRLTNTSGVAAQAPQNVQVDEADMGQTLHGGVDLKAGNGFKFLGGVQGDCLLAGCVGVGNIEASYLGEATFTAGQALQAPYFFEIAGGYNITISGYQTSGATSSVAYIGGGAHIKIEGNQLGTGTWGQNACAVQIFGGDYISVTDNDMGGVNSCGSNVDGIQYSSLPTHTLFKNNMTTVTGQAPTLSGCGTATVTGTDEKGQIAITAGAVTACSLAFTRSYPAAPACTISGDGNYNAWLSARGVSGFTASFSQALSANTISYVCGTGR